MNKLAILGLPVLAFMGLTACNPDTDPKIDTSKSFDFVLNTPQLATQFIDLSTQGSLEFTVSQPNYGMTVAPTYGIEISLNEEFEPVIEEPVVDGEGVEHAVPGFVEIILESQLKGVLVVKMSDFATGINELNGVFDESMYTDDYVGPVYVRATAHLGSGTAAEKTAVVSNIVELTQVQGYASFVPDEVLLAVPGDGNNWSQDTRIIYVKDDEEGNMLCQGFAVIKGAFKITDGDWDGSGNWGMDENTGITANDDGTFSADLIQNSQKDFNKDDKVIPDGLYFFKLVLTDRKNGNDNAKVGTFTVTPITSIALPGAYNDWNLESNLMTQGDDLVTWTAETNVTDAGWKFAMNKAWTINLGGEMDNLMFDDSNITKGGSKVVLHLDVYPWTCTVE